MPPDASQRIQHLTVPHQHVSDAAYCQSAVFLSNSLLSIFGKPSRWHMTTRFFVPRFGSGEVYTWPGGIGTDIDVINVMKIGIGFREDLLLAVAAGSSHDHSSYF